MATDINNSAQQFYELTKEGYQQLVALCTLCDEEKLAIEQHNIENFKDLLAKKQQLLVDIGHNIESRNNILTDTGLTADEQGLNSFFDSLPSQQAKVMKQNWEKLEQQLAKSAELNQRNELIVKRGQKNVSQLLALIQGHTTKTTLYNQKGSAGNYSAQNRLGKA